MNIRTRLLSVLSFFKLLVLIWHAKKTRALFSTICIFPEDFSMKWRVQWAKTSDLPFPSFFASQVCISFSVVKVRRRLRLRVFGEQRLIRNIKANSAPKVPLSQKLLYLLQMRGPSEQIELFHTLRTYWVRTIWPHGQKQVYVFHEMYSMKWNLAIFF